MDGKNIESVVAGRAVVPPAARIYSEGRPEGSGAGAASERGRRRSRRLLGQISRAKNWCGRSRSQWLLMIRTHRTIAGSAMAAERFIQLSGRASGGAWSQDCNHFEAENGGTRH